MRVNKHKPFESDNDAACRVCGRVTPLTFEHLPPSSAGNQGRAELLGVEEWLRRDATGKAERGTIVQRGSGAYTLCAQCNNRAGRLYVPELTGWTERGIAGISSSTPSREEFDAALEPGYAVAHFERVRPGRFLKQVVTMLLALAPPDFPPEHLDLQAYAQDPRWVGLPPRYQLYLALFCGPLARYNGGTSVMREYETGKWGMTTTLELAHPPFAYVLSIDEGFPAIETGNITNLADLDIDTVVNYEIGLRFGFGHTPLPLDFRTKAMLERDRAENEAIRADENW